MFRIAGCVALGSIALLMTSSLEAAINISTAPTKHMHCSAGACVATAQKAYFNIDDLARKLASGDLSIATGAAGAQDIHVEAPFSWTSASRLTLDAQRSIEFKQPVTVAGRGGLALITNDGGSGGDYWFDEGASVTFWDTSSTLIINGQSYTLIRDLPALASGVADNPKGNFALAADYRSAEMYRAAAVPTTLQGTFEGLGNRVIHLRITEINSQQQDGLFGTLQGTVRDIGVIDAHLIGNEFSEVGAVVGSNYGKVIRAFATGKVEAAPRQPYGTFGGLVGVNYCGIISSSHADVRVAGGYNSGDGGLVGSNCGTISDSFAMGKVTGGEQSYVGGLVGGNNGTLLRTHATGAVAGGKVAEVGGLAGGSYGIIDSSYATGDVDVATNGSGGGLVGTNNCALNQTTLITNSYSMGFVTGQRARLGSLLGDCCYCETPMLKTSYGLGEVTGAAKAVIGGVVGNDGQSGGFEDAYWDMDTTGISNPAQGAGNVPNDPGTIGLTDAQLKSGLPAGFDPQVWGQSPNINNGYPYLRANPPPKGNRPIRHYRSGANHAR